MADQETAGTEVKAVSVAPADTKLTIVAGSIVLVAATETGASFKSVEESEEFQPEIVIDYAAGEDTTWDELKNDHKFDKFRNSLDPRFILRKQKGYWSLGKHGWIILGFPQGFPAGQDYELQFKELGPHPEVVDFYVAQQIDPEHPVRKDQAPDVHNGVFGGAGTIFDRQQDPSFMQAIGKQTLPGAGWPPWIPTANWRYLGWIKGNIKRNKEGGGVVVDWARRLNLGYIPDGNYYYILLHDRTQDEFGADVDSVKISPVKTPLFVLLMIDNSRSADEQLDEYKKGVRSIIGGLPFKDRKVSLGVRFIEDSRGLNAPKVAEEDIPTKRHNFGSEKDPVYWQPLDPTKITITKVTEEVCNSIKMKRVTSPLLAALSAVLREECEYPPLDRGALRIILITDGLPDSYNQYGKPSDLGLEEQAKVKAAIVQAIVPKLNDIRNKLTTPRPNASAQDKEAPRDSTISFRMCGIWGPGDAWLKKTWAELEDPLVQVQSLPLVSDKPQVPENMHRIPHTDCLNGSEGLGKRIGNSEDEKYRDLGQPLPFAWK